MTKHIDPIPREDEGWIPEFTDTALVASGQLVLEEERIGSAAAVVASCVSTAFGRTDAEAREAHLRQLTQTERDELRGIEEDLAQAKWELAFRQNEFSAARALARLLAATD